MLSVSEAQARVVADVQVLAPEIVSLNDAAGRVLAEDIPARVTNPPCDVSAMDGYALRASDFKGPATTFRVIGVSAAGAGLAGTVGAGEAVRIFTGAPLPQGADTVVIQENVERSGDAMSVNHGVEILPGRHIRRSGLDFQRGDILLKMGAIANSRALSLAAAMNHSALRCVRQPRVAILATGDELVPPGSEPLAHQIVSSSPYGLMADIRLWGGAPVNLGIARDDIADIRSKLSNAQDYDVILTIGGASVGDYDLVQQALAPDLDVGFWKIAMRPGKPLISGRYRGVRFLGLPGNPVSAFVCSLLFLKPLIYALLGDQRPVWRFLDAEIETALPPNDTRQDYCRAVLTVAEGGRVRVRPVLVQDSSMLRFLSAADGLIVRPPLDPARLSGATVSVLTFE